MFAIIPSVALRNEYWVELFLLSISHNSRKWPKSSQLLWRRKKRIAKTSFDGRQLVFEKSLLENQISIFFETHLNFFRCEMTHEEQVEKFYTDDALLPIVDMSFEHAVDGASGRLSFPSGDERKWKLCNFDSQEKIMRMLAVFTLKWCYLQLIIRENS